MSSIRIAHYLVLTFAVAESLTAPNMALVAPDPAASETMQSVIDSLLTRSQERRAAHERFLAQQDGEEAAPVGVKPSPAARPTDALDDPAAALGEWSALPDPLPESLAVIERVPADATGPTAMDLKTAEAKVASLTDELMHLRGMSTNCTDAPTAPHQLASAPAPAPAPCPDWIDAIKKAVRRLDQCQTDLDDLNRQLAEREGLLAQLRAAPNTSNAKPNATNNAVHSAGAAPTPVASPCPTVDQTVVTVSRLRRISPPPHHRPHPARITGTPNRDPNA